MVNRTLMILPTRHLVLLLDEPGVFGLIPDIDVVLGVRVIACEGHDRVIALPDSTCLRNRDQVLVIIGPDF